MLKGNWIVQICLLSYIVCHDQSHSQSRVPPIAPRYSLPVRCMQVCDQSVVSESIYITSLLTSAVSLSTTIHRPASMSSIQHRWYHTTTTLITIIHATVLSIDFGPPLNRVVDLVGALEQPRAFVIASKEETITEVVRRLCTTQEVDLLLLLDSSGSFRSERLSFGGCIFIVLVER